MGIVLNELPILKALYISWKLGIYVFKHFIYLRHLQGFNDEVFAAYQYKRFLDFVKEHVYV